ncbi:MAG TPA: hypothetical protein VII19_06235, partial [Acidimicrobiales bacterium]
CYPEQRTERSPVVKRDRKVNGMQTLALDQAFSPGLRLIASGLVYCIDHPDDAEAARSPIDEVQRLFTTLA